MCISITFLLYFYYMKSKRAFIKIRYFQKQLADALDDDLSTRRWHNIIDYVIIAMILVSSVEIFISTFNVSPHTRKLLWYIDLVTLIFFTIEVSLRIWVAPWQYIKLKPWRARLKYCTSFQGFIDIISTYPFYVRWLVPFPVSGLKILRMSRVIRLFRISRYIKSWKLLSSAIKEKKRELYISIQFLVIVTFILSLILFFSEHEAQPDVYDNGFSSVVWAFAQYIGDPGNFADTPPITLVGRIIACLVGLLGIAIVAVPTGILASGFTDSIENEKNEELLKANREKLINSFERKLDRSTGFQIVPFYKTFVEIQARQHLSSSQLIDVVDSTPGFRLINLATTLPPEKLAQDRLAIEHFEVNTKYGQCIDRNSPITIVSPSSLIDATTGIFSYYLALIGGFNYISREVGRTAPYRSFYSYSGDLDEYQQEYNNDLAKLLNRPGAWSFTILAASGANENEYRSQVHFDVGGPKNDLSLSSKSLLIKDIPLFKKLYIAVTEALNANHNVETDLARYDTTSQKLWQRKLTLNEDSNHIILRLAWSLMLWNGDRLAVAKTLADTINFALLNNAVSEYDQKLFVKSIGF